MVGLSADFLTNITDEKWNKSTQLNNTISTQRITLLVGATYGNKLYIDLENDVNLLSTITAPNHLHDDV